MTKTIAIQGFEGSFHQAAARHFFGKDISTICCGSFRELIKKAGDKGQTNAAVMAIENSIAGSILPNYSLLQNADLRITGEIYLQIKQQLLVNPGIKLDDIREVHSHPMAIQQCLDFLDKYNWKLVETEDTGLSAKLVHQRKSKHIAAIASKLAAELFELEVLAANIHTQKNNYTRFLVLEREAEAEEVPDANKASVYFSTDHSKGSLARVLTKIADGGINLSKLQSFPIPGSNWLYSFHADMEFDTAQQFHQVVKAMVPQTNDFKVYGVYKKGITK